MKRMLIAACGLLLAGGLVAAAGPVSPGGALTRTLDNRDAFTRPAPGLTPRELRDFNFGNRVFNTNWAVAPASVDAFDGLGPVFNRVSCSGCHLRDGRGRPPLEGEDEMLSMLVRLSVPGRDAHGGPKPHPAYGDQFNDRAIPGVPAEGRAHIEWRERAGRYPDGDTYSLREPRLRLIDMAFGPIGWRAMTSARVAPAMPGMGLLETIPEADVLARADPDDRDGDGISGRANRVWNPASGRMELGRFGWKANAANLLAQSAGAAHGDMGLTSRVFPEENCATAQTACAASVRGDAPDLRDAHLDKLVFYLQTLAVPDRRRKAPAVEARGERLFTDIGCAACHTPVQRTAAGAVPALLAGQEFMPYTDLLLHDMGRGLADGRPDFLATGREWRTPPLWGLGLVPVTNDHSLYLHDGRARSLEEAILWHGGEAARSQRRFRQLNRDDRQAVLTFLRSL
ncbi:di-heme oxidoredictase family protein [Arenimonas daejeonensis]|uniref:di-heme oxidoreductase family protein n=1 Tax=Arenimonas daejeonensis TaxID=370777 RepID=UPI0011BD8261|nr:di-heme oxidoredictase family protein [Arenimonas daejeonensis]